MELDNIRSAIEWSTVSGKADFALRILGSLVYFWFARGLPTSEWNDWAQIALRRPEGERRTLARAKALNGIGFWYWADLIAMDRRADLEEALSIGRELGDPWNIATALRSLGMVENIQANYPAAHSFLEESLEIWRGMGPHWRLGSAMTLTFLGDLALNQNQNELARSFYDESLTLLAGPANINWQAYLVRRLGHLAWRAGDHERAFALCQDSLRINQEVGNPRGVCACLAGFAAIAVARAKYDTAATLAAAVEAKLAEFGFRLLFADRMEYERNLARLRAELDAKTLDRLWAKGKAMSLDKVIAYVADGG